MGVIGTSQIYGTVAGCPKERAGPSTAKTPIEEVAVTQVKFLNVPPFYATDA